MQTLRIMVLCGLVSSFLPLNCQEPDEKAHKEWLKKIKEQNFHLKKARKNMLAGIKILKNDIDVPTSREARQLIHWTINHYFDLLKDHKKLYN